MVPRETVGHVYVDAICHGARGKRKTLHLMVDAGATWSWMRAEFLRGLGVRPLRTAAFELAHGRTIRRPVGELSVEILGRRATTVVVFGRPRDAVLLGVYALEGLALEMDSHSEALRAKEYVLAIRVPTPV